MSFPTFIIIGVVGGGDLDGTSAESHVNSDAISNNGDFAVGKGMNECLANQVLISLVIRMNCHCCVSKHGLDPGGGNNEFLITAFHLIGKADDHSKLYWLLVAGNREQGPASQLLLVNLDVRDGAAQCARPVDQPVAPVDGAVLVKPGKLH